MGARAEGLQERALAPETPCGGVSPPQVVAALRSDLGSRSPGAYVAGRRALLEDLGSDTCGKQVESFGIQTATGAPEQVPSYRLFAAAFVCCLGPVLLGFSLGFTSPVQTSMEEVAVGQGAPIQPPPDLAVFTPSEFTMYAAVLNIGAVPGAFAGSMAMDRLGRQRALAWSAWPHMLAWCCTICSSLPLSLQLARLLMGFAVGMSIAVAPSYIGEISTASLRGPLGTAIQLSMNLGLLFVNVAGTYGPVVEEVQGESFSNWRRLSCFGVALSVGLAAMGWMPESPKWLAQQGRCQEARRALRQLRAGDTAAEEAELLGAAEAAAGDSAAASTASGGSVRGEGQRLSDYPLSLLVAVGLLAFQQLSGINAIMMYTTDICAKAGVENAELSTLGVMVAMVVLTAFACVLVETAGRRSLMQVAGMLMCLAHLGLSYYMAAQERGWWAPSWLALAALSTYIVGFATGMGPVPWLILSEVFPVEVVGVASAFATAVMWLCAFVVCLAFRGLQSTLGASGVFALFAACCFCCFLFVTALVPETKGKTVDEVLELLRAQARSVKLAPPLPAASATPTGAPARLRV